jgi:hypothetical protein
VTISQPEVFTGGHVGPRFSLSWNQAARFCQLHLCNNVLSSITSSPVPLTDQQRAHCPLVYATARSRQKSFASLLAHATSQSRLARIDVTCCRSHLHLTNRIAAAFWAFESSYVDLQLSSLPSALSRRRPSAGQVRDSSCPPPRHCRRPTSQHMTASEHVLTKTASDLNLRPCRHQVQAQSTSTLFSVLRLSHVLQFHLWYLSCQGGCIPLLLVHFLRQAPVTCAAVGPLSDQPINER